MPFILPIPKSFQTRQVLGILAPLALAACGGGSDLAANPSGAAPAVVTSTTTQLDIGVPAVPAQAAQASAVPAFHALPALPADPDGDDALDNAASAHVAPVQTFVSGAQLTRSTAGLTLQDIASASGSGSVAPMTASAAATTYTPAQIRAAYLMPALPATGATPTATQAAQEGAGQTVYIVDAQNDPNAAAELAAFNASFGLPTCATVSIAASAKLPLAAAPTNGCQFSVVYSTPNGGMTATAPAYDSGWATEIALDVQWVHATAPMARIILIEAPDASVNSLAAAVTLANTMGPGVVSMSFGSSEGSWTASVDSAFQGSNMTYLAATGDSGAGVQWPAVSPYVLAVGGTTLTYSGSGARSETVWSGSGGGVSAYTAVPSYQTSAVPGMGSQSHRNVADVSFNADPYSGQYVAVIPQGSTTSSWMSVGGTSLATPQWAALIAISNAQRAQASKAAIGAPHAALYAQIASVPGTYAADMADITKGSDGSCTGCSAKVGYDTPTGLGSPNVTSLLASLAGSGVVQTPIVTSASVSGVAGTALSYTVAVNAPDSVTYALTGAPSGLSISTAGVVAWAKPVAGTYSVTVTAKDTKTALTGQGTLTITISPPPTPVVAAGTVNGTAGTALSFTPSLTSVDPVTWSLTGAPSGMSISASGVVSWAKPVSGTYKVTAIAKDTKDGLSGQGLYTVTIAAQTPPTVSAGSVQGVAGTALSFTVQAQAQHAVSYSLSSAPSGMSISSAGVVSWTSPVTGSYSVTVTAKDTTNGLSGSAVYTVKIAASAISISSSGMTASASKAFAGVITISDPGVSSLSIKISGIPAGMNFSVSGFSLNASWSKPVIGSYTLSVTVTDSASHSLTTQIPVTITK